MESDPTGASPEGRIALESDAATTEQLSAINWGVSGTSASAKYPPDSSRSAYGPIKTFEYIGDKRRLLAYRSVDTLLARINHIGALLAQPA